jgi:hypothetical protein
VGEAGVGETGGAGRGGREAGARRIHYSNLLARYLISLGEGVVPRGAGVI